MAKIRVTSPKVKMPSLKMPKLNIPKLKVPAPFGRTKAETGTAVKLPSVGGTKLTPAVDTINKRVKKK